MREGDDYSHPIPNHVANRAATHYTMPRSDLHELLETIDDMDGLRNDLQTRSKRSDRFEVLKQSWDATYYRVARDWVRTICPDSDSLHFNATNALNQCYDRTVTDNTDAHIENGQGFVLSNK